MSRSLTTGIIAGDVHPILHNEEREMLNSRLKIPCIYEYGDAGSGDWTNYCMEAFSDNIGPVFFPAGIYHVNSLSLNGLQAYPVGVGEATVFQAIDGISGPVLDFTGFVDLNSFIQGVSEVGNFNIRGDGNADPTNTNCGLIISGTSGMGFRNISIANTGGSCVKSVPSAEWGVSVRGCRFTQPIGAGVNSIPYVYLAGWHNSNVWDDVWFIRPGSNAPVDPVSVWKWEPTPPDMGTRYATGLTKLSNIFFSAQKLPENGALMDFALNTTTIEMPFVQDVSMNEENTVNTCVLRLSRPEVGGVIGGNIIHGQIRGGKSTANAPAYGIILNHDHNWIEGPRGYGGNNVKLENGAHGNIIQLSGTVSSDTLAPAIDDQSNTQNNTFIDHNLGELTWKDVTLKRDGAGILACDGLVQVSGGIVLISPDSTKYKIQIDNEGVLFSEVVT